VELNILLQFSGAMTDTEGAEELGDFGVVSSLDVAQLCWFWDTVMLCSQLAIWDVLDYDILVDYDVNTVLSV
jgi:hypothetical protein